MTTLIVGATGATGQRLVEQLLERGERVRAIVRSPGKLPGAISQNPGCTVINGNPLELSEADMARHVRDCKAVASCLGHTMSWKGIFGPPRRLVTDTVRRLCDAIKANSPAEPVRFVLMNTAGNRNRDLDESVSFAEASVLTLVRLLPPHADNEDAADYLRTRIGQGDAAIEWATVRPDTLGHAPHVTDYEVHGSPTRSAIFNPGSTSRVNAAHFMADLITNDALWSQWKGQMPVIYDKA